MKKQSKLQLAQQNTESAIKKTNEKICELGIRAGIMYESLVEIQTLFDCIRNIPSEEKIRYEKLKEQRMKWKQLTENFEIEYKKKEVTSTGSGVAGIGAGVAVATLGPSAAMGIATTFGVASTGTAISTLSGAAATNAALAWLGGGALAAGGGGMAAGKLLLFFAGPVGWSIAGVSLIASGIALTKAIGDKKRLENLFTLISTRDTKTYELAIIELNERTIRMAKEMSNLNYACNRIRSFGTDYNSMTEQQQFELGTYVNHMEASTMLLVNPIMGLTPKFTESDYKNIGIKSKHKDIIISLANMLYKIDFNDKDKKLLHKTLRKNKEFLSSISMSKQDFTIELFDIAEMALKKKYQS